MPCEKPDAPSFLRVGFGIPLNRGTNDAQTTMGNNARDMVKYMDRK